MKTFAAAYTSHLNTGTTTLAEGLKITRTDGVVLSVTSHDVSDTILGVVYAANPGLNPTDIAIAASLAVGNLSIMTLNDGEVFPSVDIFNGVWTNAAFILFRYNWKRLSDIASLSADTDYLLTGTLGELQLKQNMIISELRDLRQYMQQSIEEKSSKTCRYRLGDSRCTKDLTSFTYSSTLTGVTNNQVFRDSTRAEGVNWFDEGSIEFTSGNNAGITRKVKSFAADGTFTLDVPLFGTVAIGDAYTAIAGCRKRRTEDCVTKFSNVLFFGGEPDRKGVDNVTESPV